MKPSSTGARNTQNGAHRLQLLVDEADPPDLRAPRSVHHFAIEREHSEVAVLRNACLLQRALVAGCALVLIRVVHMELTQNRANVK